MEYECSIKYTIKSEKDNGETLHKQHCYFYKSKNYVNDFKEFKLFCYKCLIGCENVRKEITQ